MLIINIEIHVNQHLKKGRGLMKFKMFPTLFVILGKVYFVSEFF